MIDLTAFQRDLLYVVAGLDGASGLAVKDELDRYYNAEINHGRLYPNLDTLVEKGLVVKGSIDDRTNEYAVSGRGETEIASRRQWEDQYVGPELTEPGNG